MGYIGNSPALNESVDTAQLKSPLTGDLAIGGDTDGTDRIFTFGHSTLKSVIGIDDDQDVFAINTDAAFEAANDLEINASGNMTVPGTLTSGAITSEGAFRLGSDMQFTEVAKGTISDASHASYEVAGDAVASDADGVWFLFRTTPSSDTYGTYAFYSADAGNTRMHAEIGNDSNGAVGWSGDNFTVSRNGAGTEDMVYVIYRLFDGAG